MGQFECGSGIEVEPEHRRRILGRCLPATVGLKIFAVPSAKRPAPPSFRRRMALSMYRWIAFPKALGLSNPCTASTFIVLRATALWSPDGPPQNSLGTQPDRPLTRRVAHFDFERLRSSTGLEAGGNLWITCEYLTRRCRQIAGQSLDCSVQLRCHRKVSVRSRNITIFADPFECPPFAQSERKFT